MPYLCIAVVEQQKQLPRSCHRFRNVANVVNSIKSFPDKLAPHKNFPSLCQSSYNRSRAPTSIKAPPTPMTSASPTAAQQALPISEALRRAVVAHRASSLNQAEQLYRAILKAHPGNPDANHNLGVLALQMHQPVASLPYLIAALDAAPDREQHWLSYVDALLQAGHPEAASHWLRMGRERGYDGAVWEALEARTTQNEPNDQEKTTLVKLFTGAYYPEAMNIARAMTLRWPANALAWKVLGASLKRTGQIEEALTALQKTAELDAQDAEAHSNLGNTQRQLGHMEAAVKSCRRAIALNPEFAQAHSNLGNALLDLGQLEEAIACYRAALKINPRYAEAHSNLGTALLESGQLDEAVLCFEQSIWLNPDFAPAYNNLGTAQRERGQQDDALQNFKRALELRPDFLKARSNILFTCNLMPDQHAAPMLAEARRYGDAVAAKVKAFTEWDNDPDPQRQLRIGLVSGDLRDHPVARLLESVLAALQRQAHGRIEVLLYSTHLQSDAVSERLKAHCLIWRRAAELSDADLAREIRADGVDILIDLSGHTAHNRLPLFAMKPAPVQASWLRYMASTGVRAIDYLIADPWTVPDSALGNFTEKVWRLPRSCLCMTAPEIDIAVSPLPALANGYVTFGCFNNLSKINLKVIAAWAKILQAVPNSRLFLKAGQYSETGVRHRLEESFTNLGIKADRLIMEGISTRQSHFESLQKIDVALDTFPYAGVSTTAETLWMGIPVLALSGNRVLSRLGVSLLNNAGLPEWVANDVDDYVARAVQHAGDVKRLAALRSTLRAQVLASPVFDAEQFALHFEEAMRGMWAAWCEGKV